MSDVTRILECMHYGDQEAAEECCLGVQRAARLAAHKIAHPSRGHTLQAAALVHEASSLDRIPVDPLEQPGHFFSAAAEAMWRILISFRLNY